MAPNESPVSQLYNYVTLLLGEFIVLTLKHKTSASTPLNMNSQKKRFKVEYPPKNLTFFKKKFFTQLCSEFIHESETENRI